MTIEDDLNLLNTRLNTIIVVVLIIFIFIAVIFFWYILDLYKSEEVYFLGKDITTTTSPGQKILKHRRTILFKAENSNKSYYVDFSEMKPPSADPIHLFYDIGVDDDTIETNNTKLHIYFGDNKLTVGSGFATTLIFDNTGLSVSLVYIDGIWRAINLGASVDEV